MLQTDFLVIGSGIAGLSFALKAAKHGKVLLITKDKLKESNTLYAQGGLAGVFSKKDSFKEHINNTLRAGDGICNKKSTEILVKNAPKEILWLKKQGVKFDKNGKFSLSKEAVHSYPRIVHAGDITGESIQKALIKKVKNNKNITIKQYTQVIKIITKNNTCYGTIALKIKNNKTKKILAKAIILATGGLGKLYQHTCNPDIATGDGYSLAYQAGCKLQDMEFIQFHPTSLYKTNFLISETLRGEGGHLINKHNEIYMPKYHREGELAPRDVVSKFTIDEMHKTKSKHVYLDVTHLEKGYIKKRFPKIYKRCLKEGINITKKPIPVSPTAHYSCGGIKIDNNAKTNIKNLYAIGEVSCSGLHGADRLASNSLTEGLVFGTQLIKYLSTKIKNKKIKDIVTKEIKLTKSNKKTTEIKKEIKKVMWDKVGIIRTKSKLKSALKQLNDIEKKVRTLSKNGVNKDIIELINMLVCSKLITKSALRRKESRGTHYIKDYPVRNDKRWKLHSIIDKKRIIFEK